MKKEKGFTLVEILAVIALLAIIMVIAVPSVLKMSSRMKLRGLDSKLGSIKEAAVNYTQSHANQYKSQLLSENNATACNRSVATILDTTDNVYYASNSKGERWCECDKDSKSGEDCKFVLHLTVDELIEKGALKSELTENSSSVCNISDPSRNDRCLDCLRITIKLDDDHKSADAYVSDSDIEILTNSTSCGSSSGETVNTSKPTSPVQPTTPVQPTNPSTSTYTITFNSNGGNVSTTTKTVSKGESYGTLPTPTRSGYTFNGWYTSASGGTKITNNSIVSLSSNQTLYAQWTIKSTSEVGDIIRITFNCTGFTFSPTYLNKNAGETYGTLPIPINKADADILERKFDGWYTSSGEKVTSTSIVPNSNQTLTCKFINNDYTDTEIS